MPSQDPLDIKSEIVFIWRGKDKQSAVISGEIIAVDKDAARSKLRKQGINATRLTQKSSTFSFYKKHAISSADIALFARQLASMLHAGIPIVQAIDIVGREHENRRMHTLLSMLKMDVENGESLANALKKHPRYFDRLFCNLIHAGEHAGVLESLLDKIATYKEKSEALGQKLKKALMYPCAVMVIAFAVALVLLVVVVPVFDDLFKSFGAALPPFTQWVIALSQWVQSAWWQVGIFVCSGVYGVLYLKRRYLAVETWLDKQLLQLPVIGRIVRQLEIARFTRTLSTLLVAGVPLVDALTLTSETCTTRLYHSAILHIREDVHAGQRFYVSLRATTLFPYIAQQMVAVGEESGTLDVMLSNIAEIYEGEVDNLVDNISNLIEPLMMSVVGVLVGALIIAMYLPVFKLGGALH